MGRLFFSFSFFPQRPARSQLHRSLDVIFGILSLPRLDSSTSRPLRRTDWSFSGEHLAVIGRRWSQLGRRPRPLMCSWRKGGVVSPCAGGGDDSSLGGCCPPRRYFPTSATFPPLHLSRQSATCVTLKVSVVSRDLHQTSQGDLTVVSSSNESYIFVPYGSLFSP